MRRQSNPLKYLTCVLSGIGVWLGSSVAQEYCTHGFFPPDAVNGIMENHRSIDVVHYKINLLLQPALGELSGITEVTFKAGNDTAEKIDLDFSGLTVDSVYHAQSLTGFSHTGGILIIDLHTAIPAGDTSKVTVFYHGSPQRGIYFRRNAADETVVYSHNEPFDARFWIPCNDNPADKATLETVVVVPAGYRVLANGLLTGTGNGPAGTVFTWRESYPITTYLISIAAAPYRIVEKSYQDDRGEVLLQYFVYDGDQDRAESALAATAEMMAFFGGYIAPYPFRTEKYAMGAVPFREAAAMENQTATTMRDDIIDNESIIAHELAHQWWGDAVSPDAFEHIWLNEGFASYFDALFTEHKYGRASFEQRMQEYSGYIFTDGSLEYPILNPPPRYLFGRAVYFKGAWVLHMLRNMVGDQSFREICRRYYQVHAYGNARTQDLIAISESVSGRSLAAFFDQWLGYGGIPFLAGAWEQHGGKLSIDLQQTQDEILYELDLDLRIESSSTDTTIQVQLHAFSGTWLIDFPETVTQIVIDPENKILDQNNGPLYNIPQQTVLTRLYPNPFNRKITIEYQVAVAGKVRIEILNLLGEQVEILDQGLRSNGIYSLVWDGSASASGVYFCRLISEDRQDYRKMILLK